MESARTHPFAPPVTWTEPDDAAPDRDARVTRFAMTKASGLARSAPSACRHATWGGGLRRVADADVGPSREDESRVSGRILSARSPARIVALDYKFFRFAGWRVAIPAHAVPRVQSILRQIYLWGPSAAGFARIGDTLVPEELGPGDRAALAGASPVWNDL
jgi:hypothetical protein